VRRLVGYFFVATRTGCSPKAKAKAKAWFHHPAQSSRRPSEKHMVTPKIYTTAGLGPRKNTEMGGVHHLVVYMQTAVNTEVCIYTTPGALRASGVVYIESVVFYSSWHIHHQVVHTSHFPIFPRPKPGGGVYLSGPKTWIEPCTRC